MPYVAKHFRRNLILHEQIGDFAVSYESDKFYIQDSRTTVGNSVMWWCHHGHGYTCDIRKAGIYSKDELNGLRETDIPWPVEQVNRVIQFHIDIQDLRRKGKPWNRMPHVLRDWSCEGDQPGLEG